MGCVKSVELEPYRLIFYTMTTMTDKNISSISDWIKKSLEIFFKKPNLFYLIKFALLQLLLTGVIYLGSFLFWYQQGGVADSFSPSIIFLLALGAGAIVVIFFSTWLYIATVHAISQIVDGKILGVRKTFDKSLPRVLPVFFTGILTGILVVLGFVLLIIPGIIFLIWFYFAQYVAIVEGLGPVAALRRSRQIVKGYFWPLVWRSLAYIAYMVLISAVSSLVLQPIIHTIIFTLIGPYFYVMPFLLYKELKGKTS